MRRNALVIMVLATMILWVAPMALAQNYLLQRMDWTPGGKMNPVTAVITPNIEVYMYGYANDNLVDLEVGVTRAMDKEKKLLLSLYAVTWPDYKKHFILPWLSYQGKVGSGELFVDIGYYQPLNSGPKVIYCNDVAYLWPLNKPGAKVPIEIGLSASFYRVDSEPAPVSFGPKVRVAKGLEISWLPLALNRREASHQLRLQLILKM